MPSTGNIFPGTGANDAGIGATAWTSPTNIQADDATDASCNAAASSQYLVAKNFNFGPVPSAATIRGVLVRVEASESSTGTEPLLARLQDASGALFGTGKSAANEGNISGTTKAVYTYGSTSDLWGATLTPAIVNDVDFGVRLWFATAHNIAIDYVTVAIQYTNNYSLTTDPGSFVLTAQNATITAQRKITASAGSFVDTAQNAGITKQSKLVGDAGSYALTGQDVTFRKGYGFTADAGTLTFTGADATLRVARKITTDAGIFSLTSQDATIRAQRKIVADNGTYSLTGEDVNLNYTPNGEVLLADPGGFTFTGADATLTKQSRISVDPGGYLVTGEDAGLRAGRKISADSGAYVFSGEDAALNYAQPGVFSVSPGVFTFTGADVTFTHRVAVVSLSSDVETSRSLNGVVKLSHSNDSEISQGVLKDSLI